MLNRIAVAVAIGLSLTACVENKTVKYYLENPFLLGQTLTRCAVQADPSCAPARQAKQQLESVRPGDKNYFEVKREVCLRYERTVRKESDARELCQMRFRG